MTTTEVARRVVLALAALGAGCSRGPEPPHLIVISVDTLRPDALAAYSADAGALPALDRLAAESVRFDNALSTAAWTLPAHASLLTGLYPDRHGATDRRVTMADGVATLAAALAARGYETAAFTGGGFLDPEYRLGRGFERYEAKSHGKQDPAESAPALVARVTSYLRARDDGRPLFLFLHTYAVHNYYDARAEAAARSGRDGLEPRQTYVGCVLGRASCPPERWDELRALYRAELELLDESFAALRAELERAGLLDGAVVVLLSDHGEGFEPERRRIHHGGRLHADQLRIPLLVRAPGVAPRGEPALVSLVDVMPTLLELAGAEVPPGLDGRSLVPTLRAGTPPPERALLAMEHYFAWQDGRRETSEDVRPLPSDVAVIDAHGWFLSSASGDELYSPEDASQSTSRADDRAATYRARLAGRPLARTESGLAEPDESLTDALDALGYGGE